MDRIGVGLAGSGFMGECPALAWTGVRAVFGDAPEIRLVALCEADESLARKRAAEFGFEMATTNWKALVADPAVEVVSITAPNAWHAPMAIAALEAGKHVWCEKPMGRRSPMRSAWRRRPGRAARSPSWAATMFRVPQCVASPGCSNAARSGASPTSASRWMRTTLPTRKHRSHGEAKAPPAMARSTISPSIR